jgi:type IV secretion system protein VirD4
VLLPYLRLFFEQLVTFNVDAMPGEDQTIQHQALILLDEFSQLGHMETLANAAQFAAGYGLRLCYVIQNKAQLEARYGRAAAADIIDNTGCEIVFGSNDLATTKEISERFGDTTTTAITKQRPRFLPFFNWGNQSEAEHVHRRPFMLPQEVARMQRDEQIILRAGMPPIIASRVGWYEDPELRQLRMDPPEIPRVKWELALDDGQTRIVRTKPRNVGGISRQDLEIEDVAS